MNEPVLHAVRLTGPEVADALEADEHAADCSSVDIVTFMTLELCVLLWALEGQERSLTDYENRVLALVPKHGGKVVSRVRRVDDGGGPLEVQVIHLPHDDALQAYLEDPERLALADVHCKAVARTQLFSVETLV